MLIYLVKKKKLNVGALSRYYLVPKIARTNVALNFVSPTKSMFDV